MKSYLYQHWADSTLFLAAAICVMLFSFAPQTPEAILWVWLQFPVYLIHEFEEHIFPGRFRQFINREVFKSGQDEFPLSTPAVFWINILAIWVLFPLGAVLTQRVSMAFGALLPVFSLFNASLHLLFFFRLRRYNPGLLASIFLNYPAGLYALWVLKRAGGLNGASAALAFAVALFIHAGLVILILLRPKNSSPKPGGHANGGIS